MCMIVAPICVLPLHRNHRLGGIDHVHINDLAATLLSIGISTQNSKLHTNSSSSPRTFMSLPHTKICKSLVGNIKSSSENDEFMRASSPIYVFPFINGINYNETREFSTQHVGVRRPMPQIPPEFPKPSSVLNSVKMIFNLTGHPDTTYDSTHEECQVKYMSNWTSWGFGVPPIWTNMLVKI